MSDDGRLRWLDTPQAQGWLRLAPGGSVKLDATDFAAALDVAQARGFVAADATILACMAASAGQTLAASDLAPGQPAPAWLREPALLPQLSWGESPVFADALNPSKPAPRPLDLYAIVDSHDRLAQVLASGVRSVQLRIKTPELPTPDWQAALRHAIAASVAVAQAVDAELFINDHWRLAAELGARAVHLGQEDLLALGDQGRAELRATGLALGISSHSLWELCRARSLTPRYVACGPVWPTLTKAMPWRAQGLDNLSWWCHMAGTPVVAIGGILAAERVQQAARCGVDGVCIVRGLGDDPASVLPGLQRAMVAGRAQGLDAEFAAAGPHPSLASGAGT